MNEEVLHQYWSVLVLRGLFSVLFGFAAFLKPTLTMALLVLFFGAYAMVDGIFACVSAFRAVIHHKRWWFLFLEGLVGIAFGILLFFWPYKTIEVLVLFIAAWAFITGIFELLASFTAPWEVQGKFLLGLTGVLSLVLGVVMMRYPGLGAIYLIWLMGAYALIFGTALVALGFHVRKIR